MTTGIAFAAALAVKSTAILGLAWIVTAAMRRNSAAARHAVWTAAFGAVLLLPALGAFLPGLRAPGIARVLLSASDPTFHVNATAKNAASATPRPIAATPSASAVRPSFRPDWPALALLVWALGAIVILGRSAIAALRMSRARSAAPRCAFASIPTRVPVLEGARGSMPMAFGALHPVVFLPADARDWDNERRNIVLRHELAHIERGDLITQQVARAALGLVWWNPLAWKAWREFLKERERAADDKVLRTGVKASVYASHLLAIARGSDWNSMNGLAALAMARPAQLEGRLLAILDSATNHDAPRRTALAAAAIVALAVTLPLAALQAQDAAQVLPADLEATIRAAVTQQNHEILDSAAAALIQSKNFDAARKLEDAALEVRESQSGANSGAYAEGLIKIAGVEMARGNAAEAIPFYERAIGIGDKPEAYRALITLGANAHSKKDAPSAIGYFERARNIAPTPDLESQAMILLAQTDLLDAALAPQAAANFLSAIATAPAASGQRIAAQTLYARYLDSQGRADDAQALRTQTDDLLKELRVGNTIAAPARTSALHVGPGITQPVPASKPEPMYTEAARVAKYQGSVLLYIVVGVDGHVSDASVLRPLGMGLDENAIQTVSQWTFRPATKDGQPVAVQAQVEVNFRLL